MDEHNFLNAPEFLKQLKELKLYHKEFEQKTGLHLTKVMADINAGEATASTIGLLKAIGFKVDKFLNK